MLFVFLLFQATLLAAAFEENEGDEEVSSSDAGVMSSSPIHQSYPDDVDCKNGTEITINDVTYYVIKNPDYFRKGKLCWVRETDTGIRRIIKILDKNRFLSEIQTEHNFSLMLKDSNHVLKLVDWDNRTNVFIQILEYYKNTLRGHPWSTAYIRGLWRRMLIAVKDIHTRGVINLGINRQHLLLEKTKTIKFGDFGLSAEVKYLKEISFAKRKFPLATTAPEVFSKQRLDEMKTTSSICTNHNHLKVPIFDDEKFQVKAFEDLSQDCEYAKQVGPASDIWSICCVIYEMVYQESPYEFLIRRLYAWYSIPREMIEHLILAMIIDHSQEIRLLLLRLLMRRFGFHFRAGHAMRHCDIFLKGTVQAKSDDEEICPANSLHISTWHNESNKTELMRCVLRIYFPNYEDPQIRDSLKRCLVRDPGKRPNANQLLDAISGGRFDDEL